jgi:hypothetical protein
MILKELRRRAMRASSKSNEHFYTLYHSYQSDNYCNILDNQKENIENDHNFDNESQSFYSVKSNFSSCSNQDPIVAQWSMFEEFKHLDGWPFGLWRRPVVLLPPLPPTPANSWMWLRRNSEPKAATIIM